MTNEESNLGEHKNYESKKTHPIVCKNIEVNTEYICCTLTNGSQKNNIDGALSVCKRHSYK